MITKSTKSKLVYLVMLIIFMAWVGLLSYSSYQKRQAWLERDSYNYNLYLKQKELLDNQDRQIEKLVKNLNVCTTVFSDYRTYYYSPTKLNAKLEEINENTGQALTEAEKGLELNKELKEQQWKR